MKSLVIGGTGPTGHFIVNGLLRRGHTVSILHTGRHELAEIPAQVEHIHTDPFDGAALKASLAGRAFDLTIAAYGRLRSTCEVMRGRTERFISIGGVPAYRGYSNPAVLTPPGLPVPIAEDWTKSTDRSEDENDAGGTRRHQRCGPAHARHILSGEMARSAVLPNALCSQR